MSKSTLLHPNNNDDVVLQEILHEISSDCVAANIEDQEEEVEADEEVLERHGSFDLLKISLFCATACLIAFYLPYHRVAHLVHSAIPESIVRAIAAFTVCLILLHLL